MHCMCKETDSLVASLRHTSSIRPSQKAQSSSSLEARQKCSERGRSQWEGLRRCEKDRRRVPRRRSRQGGIREACRRNGTQAEVHPSRHCKRTSVVLKRQEESVRTCTRGTPSDFIRTSQSNSTIGCKTCSSRCAYIGGGYPNKVGFFKRYLDQ